MFNESEEAVIRVPDTEPAKAKRRVRLRGGGTDGIGGSFALHTKERGLLKEQQEQQPVPGEYLLSLLQFFFSNNDRRASVAFRREIHRNEVGMETAERGPAAEKDTGKKKEKEENK
jgi:hypothetical protein